MNSIKSKIEKLKGKVTKENWAKIKKYGVFIVKCGKFILEVIVDLNQLTN